MKHLLKFQMKKSQLLNPLICSLNQLLLIPPIVNKLPNMNNLLKLLKKSLQLNLLIWFQNQLLLKLLIKYQAHKRPLRMLLALNPQICLLNQFKRKPILKSLLFPLKLQQLNLLTCFLNQFKLLLALQMLLHLLSLLTCLQNQFKLLLALQMLLHLLSLLTCLLNQFKLSQPNKQKLLLLLMMLTSRQAVIITLKWMLSLLKQMLNQVESHHLIKRILECLLQTKVK